MFYFNQSEEASIRRASLDENRLVNASVDTNNFRILQGTILYGYTYYKGKIENSPETVLFQNFFCTSLLTNLSFPSILGLNFGFEE